MYSPSLLQTTALAVLAAVATADISALSTCQSIAGKISKSSQVTYPLSLSFASDIHHWFDSSTQVPACVLNVGSPSDLSAALKLIGANKTPFAVKSGGHASNPGFSSTTGVHIVFNNMKQVTLSSDKSSVELGMGQTWADVYKALTSSGVNVVGGRTAGPGLGGFTLGGGYSWKTNQHGLTADTVKAFNVVLPNGTVSKVDSSTPDLFFAMKGGLNRFGVVTSAEYYTHQQPPTVYGGLRTYSTDQIAAVTNATTAFFEQNKDPKAQIITTLEGGALGTNSLVLFFYDGPTAPDSFKLFDGLKPGLDAVKAQSFSDFVSSFPSQIQTNIRGTFHSLSTSKLTKGFLDAIHNETDFYGKQQLAHGGTTVSYDVEPFLTSYGEHATDAAFPHKDSPLPLNLYYAWIGAENDAYWYSAMKASVNRLRDIAIAEGIYPSDYTMYPNYAISGTSATDLYGAQNAARLAAIKKQVDPAGVMNLAGGFTIA